MRKAANTNVRDLSLVNSRRGDMKDKNMYKTNVGSIKMNRNIKRRNRSISLKNKS